MKKFLIGVLVGILLMMTTPVLADSILQSINVILDSVEVQVNGEKLDANTILYNGSTYLPMRKVAEAVGKDVAWNQETMIANIVEKSDIKEDVSMENTINKEEYYELSYVQNSIKEFGNFGIYAGNKEGENMTLTLSRFWGTNNSEEEILINSIPYELIQDKIHISKDYYENTILPLIK